MFPAGAPFPYFSVYPRYIPTSMLQNTVPLEDCQDTMNAVDWLSDNLPMNASLLVHNAFYGWALLAINSSQLIFYGYGYPDQAAAIFLKENPAVDIYLIWWVDGSGWYGQPDVPSSFGEVYDSGRIAVYVYG